MNEEIGKLFSVYVNVLMDFLGKEELYNQYSI